MNQHRVNFSLLDVVGAVAAALFTTLTLWLRHGLSAQHSLVGSITILSSGLWVLASLLLCCAGLQGLTRKAWTDLAATPIVCLASSVGLTYLARTIIGRGPFEMVPNDIELLGLNIFRKVADASVGWAFAVPMWLFVTRKSTQLLAALLCSLVSVLYLIYFLLLP